MPVNIGAAVLFELRGCLLGKEICRDTEGQSFQQSVVSLLRSIFISSRLVINHSVGFFGTCIHRRSFCTARNHKVWAQLKH